MAGRAWHWETTTLTNAAESAANTETVVATLSGISPPYAGMTLKIAGWAKITMGTTATAGLLRVRRTSLTGTSISEATAETGQVGASKVTEFEVSVDDALADVGGAVYVMTFAGTGEGTAAAFLAARLEAWAD